MPAQRILLLTSRFSLLAFLASCAGDAGSGILATRADSAGVEIVTNAEPSWRPGDGWRIDPAPILSVGPKANADPRYELLRVTGGRLLPDGGVIVVVSGHFQLRTYGPDGEWLQSVGREGDGPGEFRFPGGLSIAGDTVFVGDFQLSRLSAFSRAGEFLASWPYPSIDPGGRVPPSQRLVDGRWIGSGTISFTAGQVSGGVTRIPMAWYRISRDLSRVEDTVATVAGTDRLIITSTGAGGQITSMEVTTLAVGRTSVVAVGGAFLLAGDSERPEVRRYTPDGALTTLIRWAAPDAVLDPNVFAQMKRVALAGQEGNESRRASVEARFAASPPGTPLPHLGGLHLDPHDNRWVREFAPLPTDSIRFRVFDPSGQLLGPLALGPRHTVLDIGSDRILTVWQDDDDLEHLRVYRIVR